MIDQMNKWISPDPEFFAWPGSESLRHLFWGRWQQVRLRCPNEKHGTGCCIIYIFCFPATGHWYPAPASGTGIRHRQPAPAHRHPAPPASGIGHPVPGTGIRYRHPAPASMLPPAHRHPAAIASASSTGHRHPAYGTRHPASATDTQPFGLLLLRKFATGKLSACEI